MILLQFPAIAHTGEQISRNVQISGGILGFIDNTALIRGE